jgi:putative transposase
VDCRIQPGNRPRITRISWRSWRRSPRARRTNSRPRGADGRLSGVDLLGCHDPGRGWSDRRLAGHRNPYPVHPRRPTLERVAPFNQLTAAEQDHVLAVLHSAEFIDRTPLQIYATLLRQGIYLCSVSTMYRILTANAQVKDRRRQARHPARARPELIATGPGQVYTWDITKLPGPKKGVYYDAYVMIDIYSRYIVGAHVHVTETAVLAEEMMREVFTIHGTPQVVHADRGTSMTSKTVAALLTDLGVTRSHSRPRVSNDNPFSEAWFKTLKYAPIFPERFGSLQHARTFIDTFTEFYNHNHHHTGIGLHTPADVHYGLTDTTNEHRHRALAAARAANPNGSPRPAPRKSSTYPTRPGSTHPSSTRHAENPRPT